MVGHTELVHEELHAAVFSATDPKGSQLKDSLNMST